MSDIVDDLSWLAAITPPPEARVSQQKTIRKLATVTQESPLRIQLDDDPLPLPITPQTAVAGLQVGQRCMVEITGQWLVILAAKPMPPPEVAGALACIVYGGWNLDVLGTVLTRNAGAPVEGTILITNGNAIAGPTLYKVATVAAGWRPRVERSLAFRGSGTNKATASINPAGDVWLQVQDACPANYGWRLSGTWYLP